MTRPDQFYKEKLTLKEFLIAESQQQNYVVKGLMQIHNLITLNYYNVQPN